MREGLDNKNQENKRSGEFVHRIRWYVEALLY